MIIWKNLKKFSIILLAGTIASSLVITKAVAKSDVEIKTPPPAARSEVRGRSPSRDHVWIGGYYRWQGGKYVWVPGHWVRPPRPHAQWVAGRWVNDKRGWHWVKGQWR